MTNSFSNLAAMTGAIMAGAGIHAPKYPTTGYVRPKSDKAKARKLDNKRKRWNSRRNKANRGKRLCD